MLNVLKRRARMRGNNKSFIIAMIATAVVGLVILMGAMFLGVKYFVGKDGAKTTIQESSLNKEETLSEVEYSTTVLAVVRDITEEEISAVDIESAQSIVKSIDRTTKIADAYSKTIPVTSIKKGDIVEIVYEEDKNRVLSINKSSEAWTKSKVSGAKVNDEAHELNLFGVIYTYDKNVVVLKADGTETDMGLISAYDIVTIQGIKDKILSVRIEEAAGSIKVTNIPNRQGRLELDINKMIPLSELTEPIEVTPGTHKIVVNIKGYDNIVQEIEVAPGEVYELSLDSANRTYTNVNVVINNADVEDYTIKIGDKAYSKGDKISVAQGTYTVTVTAKDYKTWTKTIAFEKASQTVKVTLQSEKTEEDKAAEKNNQTSSSNGSQMSAEESNNTEATNETKTIDIATDPSGAKVYINGVNKGTTPYKVTLPMGSYSILLEKEGYEVYSTSIILDGSDDQTGFLYVLTPNN